MAREFAWDKNSQRYRITSGPGKGSFVGAGAVRSLTESYIDQGKRDLATINDLLFQKKITASQWEQAVAASLKELHVNSYLLGIGGQRSMTQRDYGIIGLRLANEYEYLRGFSQDILAGRLSEARIRARLGLYVQALGGTYERARLESHKREGYGWKKRVRNAAESCQDCLGYADRGWVTIDDKTLPPPAVNCACTSNCRCTMRFSREEPKDGLLSMRWGFAGHPLMADLVA